MHLGKEYHNPMTVKDMPVVKNIKGHALKAPSRAATSCMECGYCGEPAMSFGTSWTEYTALVEFPQSFVDKFAGASITAVWIASPDNFENPEINNFTDINLCFYYDFDGTPFYSQAATLSTTAFEWNEIPLTTPLTIEKDKPFLVGYAGLAPTFDDSCFAVDTKTNTDEYGLWLGYTDEETGKRIWEPYTEWYGNLCLKLVVEGDNLPTDEIKLNGLYLPANVTTGEPFSILADFKNAASNDIESITLEYTIDGTTSSITNIVEPAPGFGETANTKFTGLVCNSIGTSVPVSCRISAINGNSDAVVEGNPTSEYRILSFPEGLGYKRNVVVEEGTGTWCGYCPIGIVGMEYMKEKYTDGSFIPVALHYNDPMESATYKEVAEKYFESYPNALVNRELSNVGIVEPNPELLDLAFNYVKDIPAAAEITLAAEYSDATESALSISTSSRFAIDTDDTYTVYIALTENNVGPYDQTNYFADYAEGFAMGGFEEMTDPVSLKYNDVARCIAAIGQTGNRAGEIYTLNSTIPLDVLSSKEDYSIVAMIINDNTGIIENAVLQKSSAITTEVEGIGVSSTVVKTDKSSITIAGAPDNAISTVYTTSGSVAATITGNGTATLVPGLYIVNAGGKACKVICK